MVSMAEIMMAEIGKKMGTDLNKFIDKPKMNGNNMEFTITEKQLREIMNQKGGMDSITPHIEDGVIRIEIKVV